MSISLERSVRGMLWGLSLPLAASSAGAPMNSWAAIAVQQIDLAQEMQIPAQSLADALRALRAFVFS